MDMETILEETVATEDLKKFEQKYHVELNNGKVHQPLFVLVSIAHISRRHQFLRCRQCSAMLITGLVRVSV